MVWTSLLRYWKLIGVSVVSALVSFLIAYSIHFSSQLADFNRHLGRIEGTLAATERIRVEIQEMADVVSDCGERTARIEGYLEAVEQFRQQMDSP